MKRILLLGSLVAFLGVSPAFAKDTCKGEVTSVQGNEVTIKVKDANGIKAGDKVEVELKGKKEASEAPKMMGC